jgi:hypothetical protein
MTSSMSGDSESRLRLSTSAIAANPVMPIATSASAERASEPSIELLRVVQLAFGLRAFDREGSSLRSMLAAGEADRPHRITFEILGLPDLAARVRFARPHYTVNEGLYSRK